MPLLPPRPAASALWSALLLAGLLGAAAPAPGQGRGGNNEAYLSADELKSDEVSRIKAFAQASSTQPLTTKDLEPNGLLDKAAKFYVNRVTWPQFQSKVPGVAESRTERHIVDEAFAALPDTKKKLKDDQQRYLQEMGKRYVERCKAVLNKPNSIARVNAPRILARLGEAGLEESADTFVEILEDG